MGEGEENKYHVRGIATLSYPAPFGRFIYMLNLNEGSDGLRHIWGGR